MSPPRAAATNRKPHGQIRQSQIVTTFGPGAMVDLPDHAVIIGGLDHWTGWSDHPLHEESLADKVGAFPGLPTASLYAPTPGSLGPLAPRTGTPAGVVPRGLISPDEVSSQV